MAPPIRTIVINIVVDIVAKCFFVFIIIIASFFYINIVFSNIIKIGTKFISITITDLATEHQIFCLIGNNICIIYIFWGELIRVIYRSVIIVSFTKIFVIIFIQCVTVVFNYKQLSVILFHYVFCLVETHLLIACLLIYHFQVFQQIPV